MPLGVPLFSLVLAASAPVASSALVLKVIRKGCLAVQIVAWANAVVEVVKPRPQNRFILVVLTLVSDADDNAACGIIRKSVVQGVPTVPKLSEVPETLKP